jgi:hypothetical protein
MISFFSGGFGATIGCSFEGNNSGCSVAREEEDGGLVISRELSTFGSKGGCPEGADTRVVILFCCK